MSLGVPHVPFFEDFSAVQDVDDLAEKDEGDDFGVKYKWDDFLKKDDEGDDFLENEEWDDLAEKEDSENVSKEDLKYGSTLPYEILSKTPRFEEDYYAKREDPGFKKVIFDDTNYDLLRSRLYTSTGEGSIDDFFYRDRPKIESPPELVELPSLFCDKGVLLIFGIIDEETANNLISAILLLNDDKENIDDLTFYLNSPGGSLKPGLAIFDIMQSSDLDLGLNTIGLGLVASTASLLLSGGELGCRWAFPHTRVMLHHPCDKYTPPKRPESYPGGKKDKKKPTLSDSGNGNEFRGFTNELLDVRQKVIDVFAFTTQQDPDVISRDIERDFFLSAEEAKAYGIIDHVIRDPEEFWAQIYEED